MAPTKKNNRHENETKEKWQFHDIYEPGPSCNRIVTRSQSVFFRIKNTPSDLNLFADSSRHQPPNHPPLMEVLKGKYGGIPRTIITRSFGKHVNIDKNMCQKLDSYKNYDPGLQIEATKFGNPIDFFPKQFQETSIETNQKEDEVKSENKNNYEKLKKSAKKEHLRKQGEVEENIKKQADEGEKRIQTKEKEIQKIKDEKEENMNEQDEEKSMEEDDVKEKNEENILKEKDNGEHDQRRSSSFFGGRISLKRISNIFGFGRDENKEN